MDGVQILNLPHAYVPWSKTHSSLEVGGTNAPAPSPCQSLGLWGARHLGARTAGNRVFDCPLPLVFLVPLFSANLSGTQSYTLTFGCHVFFTLRTKLLGVT